MIKAIYHTGSSAHKIMSSDWSQAEENQPCMELDK